MFWRKAKRIAELEELCSNLEVEAHGYAVDRVRVERKYDVLIKALRDQDQLIFNMNMQTSWDAMRPIFNKLYTDTEKRMRLESDRIRDALIPEMRKAYTDTSLKEIQYEAKPTRLIQKRTQ